MADEEEGEEEAPLLDEHDEEAASTPAQPLRDPVAVQRARGCTAALLTLVAVLLGVLSAIWLTSADAAPCAPLPLDPGRNAAPRRG